jgi:hypothetical protein
VWAFEVAGGVTTDTVEDLQEFWNPLHSFYAIPISLMRTGYVT